MEAEKEELLEQADAVAAMSRDDALVLAGEIPFEVDLDDWNYLLVNETHPLPEDFEPKLAGTRNGQQVDRRIKAALERMIDDAAEEGLDLLICSSYRDYEKQDSLMDESIAKYLRQGMDYREAFFETKEQIALTGASEHHTGLAVDIVGRGYQSLDRAQADTKEAEWLSEHAHEYGFILRYPEDKEEITMISFESWHYRYVGRRSGAFYEGKRSLSGGICGAGAVAAGAGRAGKGFRGDRLVNAPIICYILWRRNKKEPPEAFGRRKREVICYYDETIESGNIRNGISPARAAGGADRPGGGSPGDFRRRSVRGFRDL